MGSIDEFVAALAAADTHRAVPAPSMMGDLYIPTDVAAMTINIQAAKSGRANLKRVFYGSSATYADIHARGTFARKVEEALLRRLAGDVPILSIIGAAGVGKTTLARRLAYRLESDGWLVFEQQSDAPLLVIRSRADGGTRQGAPEVHRP